MLRAGDRVSLGYIIGYDVRGWRGVATVLGPHPDHAGYLLVRFEPPIPSWYHDVEPLAVGVIAEDNLALEEAGDAV